MTINTDLLIKIAAQNNAAGAIAGLQKDLNGLKSTVLQVGAAFLGAFAVKSIIDTTEQWGEAVKALQAETGLSAQSASRLNFVAQALGISSDELNTSLGRLAKNLFSNSVEADKGKDAFTKYGIATHDAAGHLRNVNDVLISTADKVKALGDNAESRALEMDIFGKSGGKLHELLLKGAEGVQALADESDQLGLTLNEKTIGAIQEAAIQGRVFGLAVDGLKVALGVQLLPLLTDVVRQVTKFIGEMSHAATGSRVLSGVIKTLGEAFRIVWGLGKQVVDFLIGLHDWFVKTLGPLGATRAEADLLVIALAALAGGPVLAAVVGVGLAIKETGETVSVLTDHWEEWRTAVHNGSLANQGDINDIGRTFVRGLVGWGDDFDRFGTMIRGVFDVAGKAIHDIWGGVVEWFKGTIHDMIVDLDTVIVKFNSLTGRKLTDNTIGDPFASGPDRAQGSGAANFVTIPGVGRVTKDEQASAIQCEAMPGYQWNWVNHDCFYAGGTVNHTGAKPFAGGGIVTSPTYAMIGESGPEAVIPLGRGGGMGTTINVYVSGNVAESERELAEKVGDVLLRELGHIRGLAY